MTKAARDMLGFLAGTLALAWGVMIAVLDQPAVAAPRRTRRLCTSLLIGCAAVTMTGGVLAVVVH